MNNEVGFACDIKMWSPRVLTVRSLSAVCMATSCEQMSESTCWSVWCAVCTGRVAGRPARGLRSQSAGARRHAHLYRAISKRTIEFECNCQLG